MRRSRVIGGAIVALLATGALVVYVTVIRVSGSIEPYQRLLVDDSSRPGPDNVTVTAMGTSMMLLDDGTTQILIDPFLTSVGLVDSALNRGVSTNASVVDDGLRRAAADRVAAVFVSHSHHDHALDLAHVALRTGATVHGSASTLNIARGGDVPEDRLRPLDTRRPVTVGAFQVRTLASRHSPAPSGGEGATIDRPLRQPAGVRDYKEGGTFDFLVTHGSRSMLFKGSANWVPHALDDVRVDALFLGVAGLGKADADYAEAYLDATLGAVKPRTVVPTHWNDFFSPVRPGMPLQRRLVDDSPTSFDRVVRRAERDGVRVSLLDAFSSISVAGG